MSRREQEGSPGRIPGHVIWMAVLLPYASWTMLALAGAIVVAAVLGYGYHVVARKAVNELEIVLVVGLAVVIVALGVMYWIVLSHLRRIRRQKGIDENEDLQPLATWWNAAGRTSRVTGALAVVGILLGVGLVKSELSLLGWSAIACGLLLLLATRLLGARGTRK